MDARKLSRRVEIWATGSASDGYGGYTTTATIQTTTWAQIEPVGASNKLASRYQNLGLDALENTYVFIFRRRSDFNMTANNIFLKYGGDQYAIRNVSDEDVEKSFIRILATKELSTYSLPAGGGGGFPFTFT